MFDGRQIVLKWTSTVTCRLELQPVSMCRFTGRTC